MSRHVNTVNVFGIIYGRPLIAIFSFCLKPQTSYTAPVQSPGNRPLFSWSVEWSRSTKTIRNRRTFSREIFVRKPEVCTDTRRTPSRSSRLTSNAHTSSSKPMEEVCTKIETLRWKCWTFTRNRIRKILCTPKSKGRITFTSTLPKLFGRRLNHFCKLIIATVDSFTPNFN